MSPLRRWLGARQALVLGATGVVGLLAAWEALVRVRLIDPLVFASPGRVGGAFVRQWRAGEFPADLRTSTTEFGVAFAIALVAGVALGLLMGLVRDAGYALEPGVWFLYSAPLVAFQPLLIVWLGFGFWTVVALAVALAALPIAVNTQAGVRAVDPLLLRAVRAFGGHRWDEIFKVILPAAVPLVLAGLRIGVGRVLVGVVVGEMFSANAGLGFRLTYYGARLRSADVLVPLLGLVAIGVLATQLVRLGEHRFAPGRSV